MDKPIFLQPVSILVTLDSDTTVALWGDDLTYVAKLSVDNPWWGFISGSSGVGRHLGWSSVRRHWGWSSVRRHWGWSSVGGIGRGRYIRWCRWINLIEGCGGISLIRGCGGISLIGESCWLGNRGICNILWCWISGRKSSENFVAGLSLISMKKTVRVLVCFNSLL